MGGGNDKLRSRGGVESTICGWKLEEELCCRLRGGRSHSAEGGGGAEEEDHCPPRPRVELSRYLDD